MIDERSESGTESVVRVALRLAGSHAVPQVRVPLTDFDRPDLLVGDRLVIECDSRAFHSTPEQLDRDNERDLTRMALGFVVVRAPFAAAPSGVSAEASAAAPGIPPEPRPLAWNPCR